MFESTFKNQASTALEEASSQIQNQASTTLEEITRIQKILQPSSRSKLWKVNKAQKQIRADSSTTKAKDHLPHEAPCGPISTFKIKPQRPLKKFQTKVQEQASTALEEISNKKFKNKPQRPLKKSQAQFKIKPQTALEEISSPIQDQASTALEEIFGPIQDQASNGPWIDIYNKGLQNASPTHDKHISQASRFPKNQESVLRSSFIVLPRSSPNGPLDQQSSTNSRSSPDGP
ncbi:hypothetical protein ACFX2K_008665 [Malus domestica]